MSIINKTHIHRAAGCKILLLSMLVKTTDKIRLQFVKLYYFNVYCEFKNRFSNYVSLDNIDIR